MTTPQLDVRYVANLARMELTDEEAAAYGEQLGKVLGHVGQLSKLDLDGVEPTAHANPIFDILRVDATLPGLSKEAGLSNAPRQVNGLFAVTKVLD